MDRNALSPFTRTSRSSNAMEVLGELVRHVIVDHGLYTFDIQTTRRQIGGHKIINLAITEGLQCIQTLELVVSTGVCVDNMGWPDTHLLLAEVPVQFVTLHPKKAEYDAHLMCHLFATQEYDNLPLESLFTQGGKEGRPFALFPHTNELLGEATRSRAFGIDKEPYGLV